MPSRMDVMGMKSALNMCGLDYFCWSFLNGGTNLDKMTSYLSFQLGGEFFTLG